MCVILNQFLSIFSSYLPIYTLSDTVEKDDHPSAPSSGLLFDIYNSENWPIRTCERDQEYIFM
jgi:hypothetical protein